MCSWILHRTNNTKNSYVPSIKEAQKILVNIGDKPERFVGSYEWIGALEIPYIIDYLYQIPCKIIHIPRYSKLISYIQELKDYFQKYGGFVMMGGDTDSASKGIAGLYIHHGQHYLLVVVSAQKYKRFSKNSNKIENIILGSTLYWKEDIHARTLLQRLFSLATCQ